MSTEVTEKPPRRDSSARFIESLPALIERPEYVDVGPFRFTIVWDPEAYEQFARKANCEDAIGFTENDRARICVRTEDTSECIQRETLWHEIKHACLYMSGLHGDLDRKLTQEEFVSRSSPVEFDVLRRNPHVLAYLLS